MLSTLNRVVKKKMKREKDSDDFGRKQEEIVNTKIKDSLNHLFWLATV
jgi:hypothetical protein